MPDELPSYLCLFSGHIRSSHLGRLSFVSSIFPRGSTSFLLSTFFYRSHLLWNLIPLDIREILCPNTFKFKLKQYFWSMESQHDQSDAEFELSFSNGIA